MKYIANEVTNAHYNLALEEWVLENLKDEDDPIPHHRNLLLHKNEALYLDKDLQL